MLNGDYKGIIRARDDDGRKLVWSIGPDDRPCVKGDEAMRAAVEEALRAEVLGLDRLSDWPLPAHPRTIENPHAFTLAADQAGYAVTEDPLLTWFETIELVGEDGVRLSNGMDPRELGLVQDEDGEWREPLEGPSDNSFLSH